MWYADCVKWVKVILLSAYVHTKDILYKSAKCANCIKPSALHIIINSINTRASRKVVKLIEFLVK